MINAVEEAINNNIRDVDELTAMTLSKIDNYKNILFVIVWNIMML